MPEFTPPEHDDASPQPAAEREGEQDATPLHPEKLTWAVLLSKWVEFARSAVALPDTEDGRRMKASVPDVIMLQALWFALRDMESLPHDERALGLDRAAILIDKHVKTLLDRWRAGDGEVPDLMQDLIDDARLAYEKAEAVHRAVGDEPPSSP